LEVCDQKIEYLNIQSTKLTDNVNINKLGLHAINGSYPQVGLQCRNKQTNKQCSHLVPIMPGGHR